MNIFFVDRDPILASQMLCDRLVEESSCPLTELHKILK